MNKNIKLLESFTAFCKGNPEQRFWQALRNWSEYEYILGSKQVFPDGELETEDTFYKE